MAQGCALPYLTSSMRDGSPYLVEGPAGEPFTYVLQGLCGVKSEYSLLVIAVR
jgi:hypothetical protein